MATGTVTVTVKARPSRLIRPTVAILSILRRFGLRLSPAWQDRLVAWLVDRTDVELAGTDVEPQAENTPE